MTTTMPPPSPLSGVRVLDIGHEISGPFCARLLARLGADVIKIEPPGGDPVRRMPPFRSGARAGESGALHLYVNEGKRGIVLDLQTPSGRALFLRLVEDADIVIENFEPQVLPGLELDFSCLQAVNPRVVLTSISNYGDSGPYRDYHGGELALFAMGGHMYRSGAADRPPVRMGGHPAPIFMAINAAYGTLAALRQQRQHGGQHVTCSIFENQVTSHAQAMVEVSYYGAETGADLRRGADGVRGVLARDGLAMVSAQEQQMARLAELVGAPPEFGQANPMDRGEQRRQLMERVEQWAAERTRREVYEQGQAARVPASYVADPADILSSPQYRERGFIHEVEHPDAGRVSVPGLPFQWPGAEVSMRPSPRLGEHTVEVLESLGLTREQITQLAGAGVIA